MRYVILITVIAVFWFLLAFSLSALSQDAVISGFEMENNITYSSSDFTGVNYNATGYAEGESPKSALSMLWRMFTLSLPDYFPSSLNMLVSFINWILLILLALSIYRLLNPLA